MTDTVRNVPAAAASDDSHGGEQSAGKEKRKLDKQLGDALEQTFPASDPVSIGQETKDPEGRANRQPAPVNVELAKKLARKLEKERSGEGE